MEVNPILKLEGLSIIMIIININIIVIIIKIFRSLHPLGSRSLDRAQWHEARVHGQEHLVVRSL